MCVSCYDMYCICIKTCRSTTLHMDWESVNLPASQSWPNP